MPEGNAPMGNAPVGSELAGNAFAGNVRTKSAPAQSAPEKSERAKNVPAVWDRKLPAPQLTEHSFGDITYLSDDALASSVGVCAGFTLRGGGVSTGPYASLNLATHVGDNARAVQQNRALLLRALGAPEAHLLVPNQVHKTNIVSVNMLPSAVPEMSMQSSGAAREAHTPETHELPSENTLQAFATDSYELACEQARAGADGIIVSVPHVCALLCFADCLPAVVVSPSARFAVLHAGWKGALAGIVGKALREMARQDAQAKTPFSARDYNVYIGPHICATCFEVSAEIANEFAHKYSPAVLLDETHVSLQKAVQTDALRVGACEGRIVSAQMCTMHNPDELFSYRASKGMCGRQGAFGVRALLK